MALAFDCGCCAECRQSVVLVVDRDRESFATIFFLVSSKLDSFIHWITITDIL